MPILERISSLVLEGRLWLGTKRFGSCGPHVVRVSRTRTIKGPCESAELEALKYVAQHTSIPVPKVRRTHRRYGHLYIEMEWVEGDTLAFVWSRNLLSTEEKQAIVRQVAGYINQLRSLEPPQKEIVASAELGPCLDGRVGYRVFGPFTNHEEFHSLLRGHISLENSVQSFGEAVPRIHTRQYRTCFSHADLGTGNLIVRDRKIVAVIDWQFAGWYPEYWEYTKAHYGLYNMPDWYSGFENAVTRYDNELAAEMALWERLDQPGVELEIAAQLRLERQAALPQIISTSPARSD